MYELVFILPNGARDCYFHASLQSARAHLEQFKGWVAAFITYGEEK